MARRREGCYRCEKCGTPHTRVSWHEDGSPVTATDRPDLTYAILGACASVTGHLSIADVKGAICPLPPNKDGRTREHRAWVENVLEIFDVTAELEDAGMLQVVNEPCGDASWGYAITEAGRARLAAWTRENGEAS